MTINFEQDQQDAMSKTENIQSLADQVQMLEGLHKRIEASETNIKDLKRIPTYIGGGYSYHDVRNGFSRIKTTRWITS